MSYETKLDLIQWIKMRSRMSTGRAIKVILAGALRVDSHPVGFSTVVVNGSEHKLFNRYVPSSHRGKIEVVWPKELKDAE